jgi:rare lipoprotein A
MKVTFLRSRFFYQTRVLAMLLAACACAFWTPRAFAQQRSGRAAYHLHTSEYVTASRYEPRGSLLNVMNPQNGKSVLVRVNDKGPFNGNRILDLSTGAFSALYGGLGRGVGPVSYVVVSRGSELASRSSNGRSRYQWRKSRRHTRRSSHYRRSSRRHRR